MKRDPTDIWKMYYWSYRDKVDRLREIMRGLETGTEMLCPSCNNVATGGDRSEHKDDCVLAAFVYEGVVIYEGSEEKPERETPA